MSPKFKDIFYDNEAGSFLEELIKSGKPDHANTIVRRLKNLSMNTEEQPDVSLIHSDPPMYEAFIKAHELEGAVPPYAYRLVFALSERRLFVASISVTNI